MARLLSCPSCDGRFTFADWAKTACCPHCGARVDFATAAIEPAHGAACVAVGRTAAVADTVRAAGAIPAAGAAGAVPAGGVADPVCGEVGARSAHVIAPALRPPRERLTAFGKPLALTRAWLVVFAIWIAAAGLLGVARVEMGRLPDLTARERAAIGAVEKARMADGTTFGQALRLVREAFDPAGGLAGQGPVAGIELQMPAPRWYVIDRPWEHTVWVAWELDDPLTEGVLSLVWTVRGDVVQAEHATDAFLREVVKAAARDPGGTAPVVLPTP